MNQLTRLKSIDSCDHYGILNEHKARCTKCGVSIEHIITQESKLRSRREAPKRKANERTSKANANALRIRHV
jgi:hypothetical protein